MGEPFYKENLKFGCKRCSNCCRLEPGFVFLSYNDLTRFANFFNISENQFKETYCRVVDVGGAKSISLIEKSNYDCIFWNKEGCAVYENRPLQCRSYPFWRPFLIDRAAWDKEAESCPGMNNGKVVEVETIENWLKLHDNESYIAQ